MADRIKQLSAYYTSQEIQIPINEMWSHGLFLDTLFLVEVGHQDFIVTEQVLRPRRSPFALAGQQIGNFR